MIDIHEEVLAYPKEEQEKDTTQEETFVNKITFSVDDIIGYAKKYSFEIVDNRVKNGALWLYCDEENSIHAIRLEGMGMHYKAGRGWWIK